MAGWLPTVGAFAIPAVSVLIFFLAYTSQFLFYHLQPGPLTRLEALWFNGCVLCIWWCYDRACTVDPGPKGWVQKLTENVSESAGSETQTPRLQKRMRWCKKCEAVKPPRAHHCRQCGRLIISLHFDVTTLTDSPRCIPKMDHHCPWTSNCVSHTTFPHFIRFIFYAVLSMSILAYHLFRRVAVIWDDRLLPAYLGPATWAIAHLLVLLVVNGITLFALTILLVRSVYSLSINTTMIESWEIERHDALVKRSRKSGGYVYANGGQKLRIEKQEFPYDIGIWRNVCQGMGTSIVLFWFLPFGPAPRIDSAGKFEVNGFEDESKAWPPPDPDKVPRAPRRLDQDLEVQHYSTPAEEKEAFQKRQQEDFERRRRPVVEDTVEEDSGSDEDELVEYESEYEEDLDGQESWTNSDGERLRDFGVDEDAEVFADDDIPLGELLRRRKARAMEYD
jgi:palmitoyltransferase